MSLREAAKQALEALEQIRTPLRINTALDAYDVSRAIAALRTALAEPEQKTVPEAYWLIDHTGRYYRNPKHPLNSQRTEPEQEPVALETVYETIIHWDEGGGKRSRRELARRIVALYTHPPQRKPLTDEEIDDIWNRYCDELGEASINDAHDIARAIERAHGIGGEA